jgi:Na+/melibiose symporter-like transporter
MDGIEGGPRMTASGPPPLKVQTKLLYGLGSAAYGVKDAAFRTFLLLYYNQVVGVPADLVSAAILVALVADALSDPVVGQWSDSLRTRWGRRHPLIYASAIPAALAFVLLFFPPQGLSDTMMFLYILSVSIAVRTLITFYEIPSSALAPELAPGYDDRTRIASFRYFFGVAGGLGMAFAGLYIFLAPTPDYPVGQLNPAGYRAFALTGGFVMASTILLSALGTHHRIPWLSKASAAPFGGLRGHLRHMKDAYAHRGFHAILGFGLLKFTMIGLLSALALYFGTYYWRLGSRELAILALDGILSAFVAIWLAPKVSQHLGKRNGAILLSFMVILFGCLPYGLSLLGLFVPIGSPWLVPALFTTQFFYSLAGTTSMILVHAMIADCVEEQELKTGHRSEGLFYSAHSFLQKCVSGLGVFAAGLMITFVGLPERANPATLDPAIPRNLVLLYLPLFAIGTAAAAWLLRGYRIDRASHDATLARLAARKTPAAAE